MFQMYFSKNLFCQNVFDIGSNDKSAFLRRQYQLAIQSAENMTTDQQHLPTTYRKPQSEEGDTVFLIPSDLSN